MTVQRPRLDPTQLVTAFAALMVACGAIGLAGCGGSDNRAAPPADTTTTDGQKSDGRDTDGKDTDGKHTDGNDTDGKDADGEKANGQDEEDDDSAQSTSNQVELSVPFQGGGLRFSPQAVGTTSVRRAVVSVGNKSEETASISEVKFTGEGGKDFLLADGTSCVPPLELEPGQRCSIRVTFAPTRPGERKARLTITVADGIASAEVSGIGKAAGINPAPPVESTPSKKAETTATTSRDTTETSETTETAEDDRH